MEYGIVCLLIFTSISQGNFDFSVLMFFLEPEEAPSSRKFDDCNKDTLIDFNLVPVMMASYFGGQAQIINRFRHEFAVHHGIHHPTHVELPTLHFFSDHRIVCRQ
jgi:hypothetical protein